MPAIQVPTSVVFLASGGYWETKKERGRYRVIVEEGGWEHVKSRVQIEWIAERPTEKRLELVTATRLADIADNWTVSRASISATKDGSVLELWGAEADGKEKKLLFDLGGPGKYRQRH
jgi:hypothetical protein